LIQQLKNQILQQQQLHEQFSLDLTCTASEDEIRYLDGGYYKGEKKGGKRHGIGKMIHADCSSYEGEWENDLYSGNGTLIYSSGQIYKGIILPSGFHDKGMYLK
jgi:hypothetical protein